MAEEDSTLYKFLMEDRFACLRKLYGLDSEGKKIDGALEPQSDKAQREKTDIAALQRRLDELEGALRKHGIDVDEHCREIEDDDSTEFVNPPW